MVRNWEDGQSLGGYQREMRAGSSGVPGGWWWAGPVCPAAQGSPGGVEGPGLLRGLPGRGHPQEAGRSCLLVTAVEPRPKPTPWGRAAGPCVAGSRQSLGHPPDGGCQGRTGSAAHRQACRGESAHQSGEVRSRWVTDSAGSQEPRQQRSVSPRGHKGPGSGGRARGLCPTLSCAWGAGHPEGVGKVWDEGQQGINMVVEPRRGQ